MRHYLLALSLLAITIGCAKPPSAQGPFERAGRAVDTTVDGVTERSKELAQKTVRGTRRIVKSVAHGVEHAAGWVEDQVSDGATARPPLEEDAAAPTPYPPEIGHPSFSPPL